MCVCVCVHVPLEPLAITTCSPLYSPSGKLVQIEYALQAVAGGSPSVGIKGERGQPSM